MNQVQIKQLSPVEALKQSIMAMTPQFLAALPKHISVDKFVRVILTAANTSPKLVSADRNTFFASCMKAASDGLLPDGKESALVPYNTQGGGCSIQYIPMYAGILKKIRNSGLVAMIDAVIVYKNEKFSYSIGTTGPQVNHEPDPFGADPGEVRGVYAYAILKDGSRYYEFLSPKQVDAIKSASKSAKNGPWSGQFELEMWKKSAVRRLSKRLPMSTDIEKTFEHDDDDYELDTKPMLAAPEPVIQIESTKVVTPEPTIDKTKPNKLSKIITEQAEEIVNEEIQNDDII